MSFSSLGLTDALVRAVADVGYTEPTPIQKQAIPAVLAGGDLLAGAQTGTGKTAGFVLPILQRLAATPGAAHAKRHIRSLIITPTRELAAQVEESVRVYGKYMPLKSGVVFGGVGINPQIDMLKRGIDILVATPGRLLDHHGQKTIDLSHVEILVLDEADRMLDMGFLPDIKRVLKIVPAKRQNLLFSATFSDEIRELANGLLKSPAHIQATPRNTPVELIAQKVLPVDAKRKTELLIHLIKEHNWFQVLVFSRTKHGANRLAAQLEKNGVAALPIHGNKSQNARTRAMAEFKSAKLQVLVATDIAARGIDIDDLPHVVNFDLPSVAEDYVHRIGRTGRAGASGEAISLVSPEEAPLLRDIERYIRREIPRVVIPGFEKGSAPKVAVIEASVARDQQGRGRERSNEPRAERGNARGRSGSSRAPARGSNGNSRGRSPVGAKADARNEAGHKPALGPATHARRAEHEQATAAAPRAAGTTSHTERAPHVNSNGKSHAHSTRADRTPESTASRSGARKPAPDTAAASAAAPSGNRWSGKSSNPRREEGPLRSNLPPGWPGAEARRR